MPIVTRDDGGMNGTGVQRNREEKRGAEEFVFEPLFLSF
jgi:hypothetical protein